MTQEEYMTDVPDLNNLDENIEPEAESIKTGLHLLIISTTQKITTTLLCQLEYLFKKSIGQLEEFRKIEIAGYGRIHITYFGDIECIERFTEKIKPTPFSVVEVRSIEAKTEEE